MTSFATSNPIPTNSVSGSPLIAGSPAKFTGLIRHSNQDSLETAYSYSYRGHLRSGYLTAEGKLADYLPGGEFLVEIGPCEHEPGSLLEEARRAAVLIRESTREDLWLCMSGGVDSECMVRAFLAAGIRFSVAIMRFSQGLNHFDIVHAIEFCERYGIVYRFFDLDIDRFYLDGHHFEIAHRFRCSSPQLTTHIHLMKQIPGFPVLAWNIPHIYLTQDGKSAIGFPDDLYFSYHRFFDIEKKPGVAFFFLYTPELFYAPLRIPFVQDLLFQRAGMKARHLSYSKKCRAYRDGGFAICDREDKFTGFERVKTHFAAHFDEDGSSYDRHFREPLKAAYPPPSRVFGKISKRDLIPGFQPGQTISEK